jgi:murein L,D-transpeptidase YcbB/YkuD
MTRRQWTGKGIAALLFLLLLFPARAFPLGKNASFEVPDAGPGLLIREKITAWGTGADAIIGGEHVYTPLLVSRFYESRNYLPAWSANGRLTQADSLIRAVEAAYYDGLTPAYYHLQPLKTLMQNIEGKMQGMAVTERLATIDILLTDAFLALGCHLSGGCVDPVTLEQEWNAKRQDLDVASVLDQALRKRQIREALAGLRPAEDSYRGLSRALAEYRALRSRGGWPSVPGGPLMKKGTMGARVIALRKRLAVSGDLAAGGTKKRKIFDRKLQQSVILFQRRHGLGADGVVGPETLAALNVPIGERIRQIELNMERLRWVGGNLGQRAVVINIANFSLDAREGGKSVLSMKVVVGKPFWDTPVFNAKMTYLVLNPSWTVPDSIAKEELLEKIKKDPDYLISQKIAVLRGWGSQEEDIDPERVDWSKVTPKNLIYRFRQKPGSLNPLGTIKFMLPNKFNIYLHDTPAKHLFSEHVRTFSHGCTRIEKPLDLAAYVLRDDPQWTREKLLAALAEGKEKIVRIAHPVDVYFLYLTAWVDCNGALQFRDDIYGRDSRLDEALRTRAYSP